MQNKLTLHEGEILRILIKRAGLKVDDVAPALGIVPNSLSRLFKSEKLSKKVKSKSASFLKVEESIFETGICYELPDIQNRVEEPGEHERLKEEVARLERLVAEQAAALLKERAVSERLEGLLKEFMERVGAGK